MALTLDIEVKDDGSKVVKKFSDTTKKEAKEAEKAFTDSTKKMKRGSDDFKKSVDSSNTGVGKFAGGIKNFTTSVSSALGPLTALVGSITAVSAVVIDSINETTEFRDEITKLSAATGISTEKLSGLGFAAERSGVSVDSLDKAVGRFARNISDANNGLSTAVRAFENLDVTVTDSDGALRNIDDVLLDVADAFVELEDDTQKAAIAQELFGRSGLQLVPLLEEGRQGIEDLRKEAERLGITFDQEAGEAAEAYQDAILDLQTSVKGLQATLAEDLIPAITGVIQALTDVSVALNDLSGIASALGGDITSLATDMQSLAELPERIGRNSEFMNFALNNFNKVLKIVGAGPLASFINGLEDIGTVAGAVGEEVDTLGGKIESVPLEDIEEELAPAVELTEDWAESVDDVFSGIDKLLEKLEELTSPAKEANLLYREGVMAVDDLNIKLEDQREILEDIEDLADSIIKPIKDQGEAVKITLTTFEEYLAGWQEYLDAAELGVRVVQDIQRGFSDVADLIAEDLVEGGLEDFDEKLKDIGDRILKEIISAVIEWGVQLLVVDGILKSIDTRQKSIQATQSATSVGGGGGGGGIPGVTDSGGGGGSDLLAGLGFLGAGFAFGTKVAEGMERADKRLAGIERANKFAEDGLTIDEVRFLALAHPEFASKATIKGQGTCAEVARKHPGPINPFNLTGVLGTDRALENFNKQFGEFNAQFAQSQKRSSNTINVNIAPGMADATMVRQMAVEGVREAIRENGEILA